MIAFLGPESEATAAAVDLIKRISYVAELVDEGSKGFEPEEGNPTKALTANYRTTLEETENLGISYAATNDWYALHHFFDYPWFERIWVVQEMLPCQEQGATQKIEALCVIGSHTLRWDAIKYTASWIYYKGERCPQPPTCPKVDGLYLTMSMRLGYKSRSARGYKSRIAKRYGHGFSRGKFDYRALHLLNYFRTRDATDPRDKVYGLLGISDLQEKHNDFTFTYNPKIDVDYRKPVIEVYRDVAKALIDDQKRLTVILSATPHSEDPGWPTWLPDWRIRDLSDIGVSLPHQTPDGGIPLRIKESPSPNNLRIEGKVVGTATFVHSARHMADVIGYADARILCQRVVDLLGSTYHATGESVATAFTLTLSCGQLPKSVQDAGTSAQKFADLVLDYLDALKPHMGLSESVRCSRGLEEFQEYGFGESWPEIYRNTLCERRVFVTETGFVGLGYHMVEGDVVAVLFGLPVACVLRPCSDRAMGWYEFVGEAYAHGAMDGKVVEDMAKDESGRMVGEEFFLV